MNSQQDTTRSISDIIAFGGSRVLIEVETNCPYERSRRHDVPLPLRGID